MFEGSILASRLSVAFRSRLKSFKVVLEHFKGSLRNAVVYVN